MLSLSDTSTAVRPGHNDPATSGDWRADLRDAFRDPFALCDHLNLPKSLAETAEEANFPLLAPRPFVARMQSGDPLDPLFLQVMPSAAEGRQEGLPLDAVGDLAAQRSDGLLQKYQGRALFILAGNCAVNCRYCFRRHYPYAEAPKSDAQWEPALQQIESDPGINEVILSGGDPLVLNDSRIERLVSRLEAIPHVARLRIHTRLPVVVPNRVTNRLCQLITATRLATIVVLHINHPSEINHEVAEAVEQLRNSGAMLLNQSVLLKQINDQIDPLTNLCERLVQIGVMPYYLHQLDLVAGVGHFGVPESVGHELIAELRRRLPGYAVPRYVAEIAGEPHKTVLA